ncbi:unnamed protein product [Caenorhabditis auriculariae]|uniref:Uncharacterized protein n=1 Tax=Caenorhabditis auriculariae TaxID=2777116 RepID=A0A8S1HIG1_9PELO|nr:unnamed protein product [Caenorhabditis auriculariae]
MQNVLLHDAQFILEAVDFPVSAWFSVHVRILDFQWVPVGNHTSKDLPVGIQFPLLLDTVIWSAEKKFDVRIATEKEKFEGRLFLDDYQKARGWTQLYSTTVKTNATETVSRAVNTTETVMNMDEVEEMLTNHFLQKLRSQTSQPSGSQNQQNTEPVPRIPVEQEDQEDQEEEEIVEDPGPSMAKASEIGFNVVPRLSKLRDLDALIAERMEVLKNLEKRIRIAKKIDEVMRNRKTRSSATTSTAERSSRTSSSGSSEGEEDVEGSSRAGLCEGRPVALPASRPFRKPGPARPY